MIVVTRLGSETPFALNADLIERIEVTPDTVLVMVDGSRYIIAESLESVVEKIREERAQILARVEDIQQREELDWTEPAGAAAADSATVTHLEMAPSKRMAQE